MKLKQCTLATLLALTLSACGSGGGGSGTAQTPDGDKINLTLSPEGTVGAKTKDGTLIGQNNSASFYGAWKNDAETFKELRYQGTKTTDIPTAGVAHYKGDAVYISGYDKSFKQGGETNLDVDFYNKTVQGDIKFSVLDGDEFRRDITLHKTALNGADFNGRASVLGNSGGHYEGALFGENAKEAAGVVHFENDNNLDVSFGGKKQ